MTTSLRLRRWARTVATGAGRSLRHPWARRVRIAATVLLISLTGVVVGTMLFANADVAVGPFRAEMAVSPSISGGTEVDIPPLGSLHLDSHHGPIHLKVNLGSLDQERTEALLDTPGAITAAGEGAVDDVTKGVLKVGLRALGAAVVCALLLAALVFRNARRVAWAGGLALAVTGGSLGLAAATVRPDSISEPRYEGLLVNAPAVVGDARRIADNYGRYAEQLEQIVGNVSRIYTTVSSLPVYEPEGNTTRVLHVSDLHLNPGAWGIMRTVVQQFEIDAIVDTGDIVDWGSNTETSYVAQIADMGVPYIYVRGNHDSVAIEAAVARQPNARVLDNSVTSINGLTIAGIADPEFTPDKSETPPAEEADEPGSSPLLRAGAELAGTIRAAESPVHLAMVHDPAMAPPLSGTVPVVLAGHRHQRDVSMLEAPSPAPSASAAASVPAQAPRPTRLMVQGSTGGAGLRGLEGEDPTPLALSVLYFDERHELKAYDDIELAGTGQSQVTLERNVVGHETEDTEAGDEPGPLNGAGSAPPSGTTPAPLNGSGTTPTTPSVTPSR